MSRTPERSAVPAVGWREWVALPDLHVPAVKAKIDTGARSSSLHVFSVEPFRRDGVPWVRFVVHPFQRSAAMAIVAEAPLTDERLVRSTSGHQSLRPVVETTIELGGRRWPIELTLANRDEMGFRMLVGRQALRRRFVVDPGRSYLAGRPPKAVRRPPVTRGRQ